MDATMKKKEQVSLKPESEYRLSESNSLQPVTITPPPLPLLL